MEQALDEDMISIGVFMAQVCDNSFDEGTLGLPHDVPLALCMTTYGYCDTMIMTPEIKASFRTGLFSFRCPSV